MFHTGTGDTARSNPRSIKKDYRTIGSSGEVLQSSDSGQSSQLRGMRLQDLVEYSRSINDYGTGATARDCLVYGTCFEKPGLLETYGVHLSEKKSIFGHRFAKLVRGASN